MLPNVGHKDRFGFAIPALWLIATVGAAGCDARDIEEFLGDVGDSTVPAPGTAIPFEEFIDDVGTHAAIEARVLIRSARGYQDFFGHAPPAGVDFGRQWVIFYAAGAKPTGGYDANLLSLTRSGQVLRAVTQLVSPGSDCVVTQAFTAPWVLVKFAAQGGASVEFTKSNTVSRCGPTPSACATILCAPGSHCEEQTVMCVRAPCPPVGICVPDTTQVRCGGIAGIACPGGGRCVDDPTDSCDPNAGGADCGGICQCVQTVLCTKDTVFDSSPKVCACVPAPRMCPPVCQIFCEYGNVLDANGCPTCRCNPAPTPKLCSRDQCPSPAPAAPNFTCPDGKTIGGPACVAGANGSCGWTIVTCPPTA